MPMRGFLAWVLGLDSVFKLLLCMSLSLCVADAALCILCIDVG